MATTETSPAKKTYRVWADHIRRMFQDVEAANPAEAQEIARGQPECWENCFEHEDRGDYRLSDEVQNTGTEKYHWIHDSTHCKTCGSEIVDDINDSHSRKGECGPCEHERYRSSSPAPVAPPAGGAAGDPPPYRFYPPERWAAARADSRWASDRWAAGMRERFERYPALRGEDKIRLALDILFHVSDEWDQVPLEHYPEELGNFDEFLYSLMLKLRAIRWTQPGRTPEDSDAPAA
jgi:hypothetical protein